VGRFWEPFGREVVPAYISLSDEESMTKAKKRPSNRPGIQKPQTGSQRAAIPARPDRRKTLRRFRNGAMLVIGLGGGSFYVGSSVLAGIQEADLSKIGNGLPTIVQIHDPQCPTCRALQREARQALAQFEEGELQYLVANIRKDDGRALAAEHKVQHVTLLLLDGSGKQIDVITGLTKSAYLEVAFRRHLARLK